MIAATATLNTSKLASAYWFFVPAFGGIPFQFIWLLNEMPFEISKPLLLYTRPTGNVPANTGGSYA
jgi:hypothetical protein